MFSPTSTPLAVLSGRLNAQGAISETEIRRLPALAVIRRVRFVLVSGTGTKITPALCSAPAGIGTIDQILVGTPGAEVDVAGLYIPFQSSLEAIFLTPQPDAGADNVVDYQIFYTI